MRDTQFFVLDLNADYREARNISVWRDCEAEDMAAAAFEYGNCVVAIDEVSLCLPDRDDAFKIRCPRLYRVAVAGRHLDLNGTGRLEDRFEIGLWLGMQRPIMCPNICLANAKDIRIFRCVHDDDIKRLARYVARDDLETIRNLPLKQHIFRVLR